MSQVIESTNLYYKEGSSDKVYIVYLVKELNTYYVNISYGRRNSTLTNSCKMFTAHFAAAKDMYNMTVAAKKSKGYKEVGLQTPNAPKVVAKTQGLLLPQLLNAIDLEQAKRLIEDDNWLMQQKMDGNRVMVAIYKEDVRASNRSGGAISLPVVVENSLKEVGKHCKSAILDGELIGEVYHIFDVLSLDDKDLKNEDFVDRVTKLNLDLPDLDERYVRVVKTIFTSDQKKIAFRQGEKDKVEGFVFKKADSKYKAGRPNSGGTALKYKFLGSATCIVLGQNASRRSIQVGVSSDDVKEVYKPIGNCTVPVNHEIPSTGTFVEICYLHAYENGSLYQPVYKGERKDKLEADLYTSLKFKQVGEEI